MLDNSDYFSQNSFCTVCMVSTHIVDHYYLIYKLRWCIFRKLNCGECAVICNLNSNLANIAKVANIYTYVQTRKALRRTWTEREI